MARERFSSATPQDWFNRTIAKLPDQLTPRLPNPTTIGPKTRIGYADFLSLIYKYADALELQIHVEEDLYRPNEFFLYLTGKTLKPDVFEAHRIKRFQLSLNRAYVDGVQPEQIVNFKNIFCITDPDNKFYQDHNGTPY